MTAEKKNSVYSVTKAIVYKLNSLLNTPAGKALFSDLRNSIGKPLGDSIGIWSMIFQYIPEEFIGKSSELTYEEKSIVTSLQLFALHQQGVEESVQLVVDKEDNSKYLKNIGYSLNSLRVGDKIESIDRRFNAMITSDTFEELSYYLRQMISLLKSNTDAKVNYPLLANDLYQFLWGNKDTVRLNWARRYYNYTQRNDNEGDINNEK